LRVIIRTFVETVPAPKHRLSLTLRRFFTDDDAADGRIDHSQVHPTTSDEVLCERWVENPYCQFFCGTEFFQHRLVFDRSSLTRWRQRMRRGARPRSRRAYRLTETIRPHVKALPGYPHDGHTLASVIPNLKAMAATPSSASSQQGRGLDYRG
jgi:hypothetical protein